MPTRIRPLVAGVPAGTKPTTGKPESSCPVGTRA